MLVRRAAIDKFAIWSILEPMIRAGGGDYVYYCGYVTDAKASGKGAGGVRAFDCAPGRAA